MLFKLFVKWNFITCLVLILSIVVFYFLNPSLPDLEQDKCPICFGQSSTLCEAFDHHNIIVYSANISDKINNFVSSKNLIRAMWNDENIVLKKLASSTEWTFIDTYVCDKFSKGSDCNYSEIDLGVDELMSVVHIKSLDELSKDETQPRGFLCGSADFNNFLNQVNFGRKENLWTAAFLNPEPIFLQIFNRKDGWPVPHFLGACGRVIAESHCGSAFTNYLFSDWFDRANFALQLLQAMLMFTNAHPIYRVYLTDLSVDNIVVDANHRLYFIDLENFILKERKNDTKTEHTSENFDEASDNFSFSSDEICRHDVSDHNYYAACQIFLSPKASWPMVPGGLLHSMPAMIREEFPAILKLVSQCTDLSIEMEKRSRHDVVVDLMNQLELALADRHNYS